MATNTVSFRIILAKINQEYRNLQEEISSALAHTFQLEQQEVRKTIAKLPVVLFDELSIDDVKRLKDPMTFMSKLGLEFNVTPQKYANIPRTGWKLKKLTPIAQCPNCGESFLLISAGGCLQGLAKDIPIIREAAQQKSTPQSEKRLQEEDANAIPSEFEEVEALSAELESIVGEEDEIEEIGSVSEELEEIGSFSDELEKIGDISAELEKIASVETSGSRSSEIEDISGISAEFEEIEGVSAEFENVTLESLGEDIGSLSAELEEIESISGEFDSISDNKLEKVDEVSRSVGSIDFAGMRKSSDYGEDDLEGISKELERIADPLHENILDQVEQEPQSPPAKPASNVRPQDASLKERKLKKPNIPQAYRKQQAMANPMQFPPGSCTVLVNFTAGGNVQTAIKVLSHIKGVPLPQIIEWIKRQGTVSVAENISQDSAEEILNQFRKLKLQGRVVVRPRK